jgi:hypothetical protein
MAQHVAVPELEQGADGDAIVRRRKSDLDLSLDRAQLADDVGLLLAVDDLAPALPPLVVAERDDADPAPLRGALLARRSPRRVPASRAPSHPRPGLQRAHIGYRLQPANGVVQATTLATQDLGGAVRRGPEQFTGPLNRTSAGGPYRT